MEYPRKNKYTKLLGNTLLFGVSSVLSKLMGMLLSKVQTTAIPPSQMADLGRVQELANLLIPLVSLCMASAVIRFGLVKGISRSSVFTNSLVVTLSGCALLAVCSPLLAKLPFMDNHTTLLCVMVLMSNLRSLCSQLARVKNYLRLYAIDGILTTVYLAGFNILFLNVFKWGPAGYLLAIIASDFLSALGLMIMGRLFTSIKLRSFNSPLLKKMLRYTLPLVPSSIFWSISNMTNKYVVYFYSGKTLSGIYDKSYMVPNLMIAFSTVFTEAWQLSAFTDGARSGRNAFFSRVYGMLLRVIMMAASGLIVLCQFFTKILVHSDYYEGWIYVPLLIIAMAFSALSNFQNTVYMVEKKSKTSLATFALGVVVNLALLPVAIPLWGPQGASLALLAGYLVTFAVRVRSTRKLIRIYYRLPLTVMCTLLLGTQVALALLQPPHWNLWSAGVCAIVVVLNMPGLVRGMLRMLRERKG